MSEFPDHLKSVYENIQFTMGTERDGHLPFLYTDIHRKPDGSLGHKVYSKPIHTNRYPHSNSHHHPSNQQAVLSMPVHTAKSLCDQENLHMKLDFLRTTFRQNSYRETQIRRGLNPPERIAPPPERPAPVAFLPYVSTTVNHISRPPNKHIKSVGLSPKSPSFLRSVKDDSGLNTPAVYSVPCECGHVYIGQTGRSIETRIKEHHRHIHPEQTDKSAEAEHSINLGHRIKLEDTTILSTKATYIDRMIREDIEIEPHPRKINTEDGLRHSRAWKPLIHTLR
jgi:hypothetical protein